VKSFCDRSFPRWVCPRNIHNDFVIDFAAGLEKEEILDAAAVNAPIWPLVVYFFAVLVVAGGMLGISALLGERHQDRETGEQFESGIKPTGDARVRFSARYYQVAMFFVIFDLESVFVIAWAVGLLEVGWLGYIEIVIFILVLLAGLLYLWRVGALDWGPRADRKKADRT
jgi:NADH-quinone oxidoreductase subunit A